MRREIRTCTVSLSTSVEDFPWGVVVPPVAQVFSSLNFKSNIEQWMLHCNKASDIWDNASNLAPTLEAGGGMGPVEVVSVEGDMNTLPPALAEPGVPVPTVALTVLRKSIFPLFWWKWSAIDGNTMDPDFSRTSLALSNFPSLETSAFRAAVSLEAAGVAGKTVLRPWLTSYWDSAIRMLKRWRKNSHDRAGIWGMMLWRSSKVDSSNGRSSIIDSNCTSIQSQRNWNKTHACPHYLIDK